MTATIDDFGRLDMRVGEIVDVAELPQARKPSFRLTIDFGVLGRRQSVAALKTDYPPETLLHRQVVCVFNLPPRRIAGVSSEVLVLAATHDDGTLRLLVPEPAADLGSRIT
jgi:tRNA-binding protein